MKAIVRDEYGPADVLRLDDVDVPVPVAGEVLIRVRAASVTFGDRVMMRSEPLVVRSIYGMRRPRTPGLGKDVAGVVESVGSDVSGIGPGDEVMAEADFGAFAELVCVPARFVAPKPATATLEEAAAIPAAGTAALQGLRDAGGVRSGQRVLVVGASGGVGTWAVQLAAALGRT